MDKGDILVELDLNKIDQAIKDLKIDRSLAELALKQTEDELPVLERSTPLDLAEVERAEKQADENLKKFLEIDRPQSEKMAEFQLKSSKHYVEYAREELKQLQEMYRDKDLTEETEELILRRQRHQVEAAEFSLKNAEIQRDSTLLVELPRREIKHRDDSLRRDLALTKARIELPLALDKKRIDLQKLRVEHERTGERLEKLERDREVMTIRTPAAGIVYFGHFNDGRWSGPAAVAPKLRRGGSLMMEEVLMTIVEPRPVSIRANVDEKDLDLLSVDLKGKAVPTAFPTLRLPVRVESLSVAPTAPGTFEARVAIDFDVAKGNAAKLMPGMACSLTFVSYSKDDALTLPSSAVFEDDDSFYVYVHHKDAAPEKVVVKVGRASAGKTEILAGPHGRRRSGNHKAVKKAIKVSKIQDARCKNSKYQRKFGIQCLS